MQDCTTCPNKEYCIPDECLGTKKMPSRTAMRKGHIEKHPFRVYHIVKPKGNKTMIELKITVDKAVELEQEVKDLYQSIVGAPVKDVEPANWTMMLNQLRRKLLKLNRLKKKHLLLRKNQQKLKNLKWKFRALKQLVKQ